MVAEHTPAAKVSAESLEATCAHPLANTESCTHCMASTASGSAQVTVHSSDQPAPWPHSTFCRVQPAYPARSGYMYGVSASVSSGAHSSNSSQVRSEEHTSELQSRGHLVCRLLLEKKKKD